MRNNYSKIKFSKKLNKYTYYYRGCYRTSQGIENKRKKQPEQSAKYLSTEIGYFTAMWQEMK